MLKWTGKVTENYFLKLQECKTKYIKTIVTSHAPGKINLVHLQQSAISIQKYD